MRMIIRLGVLFPLLCSVAFSQRAATDQVLINDHSLLFTPNHLSMWFINNGMKAYNPVADGPGLEWPAYSGKYIGFALGTIWGGFVDGEFRAGGSFYRSGLQPGVITPNGTAADPADPRFRIYHIKGPGDKMTEVDYLKWPSQDGAPTQNGLPLMLGDDQIWYVANDLDSKKTAYFLGTPPIGLEIQTTAWALWGDALKDVIFVRDRLINKGRSSISAFRYGLFADFDIGNNRWDDVVGVDTTLQLGYFYSSVPTDSMYGKPPAAGILLLQSPRALYAFSAVPRQLTPSPIDPGDGCLYLYQRLANLNDNGNPIFNPLTGIATRFCYSGNPVSRTGWVMDAPYTNWDAQFVMGCGEIEFAPSDTIELVYALIAAQGPDKLQSVKKMELTARYIRTFFGLIPSSEADSRNLISDFHLYQNYPNPFGTRSAAVSPFTRIPFFLPQRDHVTLKVCDLLGRHVATLVDAIVESGFHEPLFSPADALPSGMYMAQLTTGSGTQTKQMFLVR